MVPNGHTLTLLKPHGRVLTDGTLSKPFEISNGTRQGCPLSPLIFALIMEPLEAKVRVDKRISGIKHNDVEHKISLFANYVILLITNPAHSMPAIQDIIAQFSSASFYKINSSKSLILPLNLTHVQQSLLEGSLPYSWTKHSIPYIGIKLAPSLPELYDLNYRAFQKLLPQLLNQLRTTGLSKLGRIASFKMLILPKLLYLFRSVILPVPHFFFTSIQKQLSRYIWETKPPRCAHYILTRHHKKGGLSLPHIQTYYYASILDQLYY